MAIGLVIAALTLGAVTLVGTLALRLARRLPLWFVPALIAAFFTAGEYGLFHRDSPLLFVLVPALLGGALAVASRPSFSEFPRARQVGISLAILLSSGLIVLYFAWRGGEGTTDGLVEVTPPQHALATPLAAPDPGESGPYAVLTLTYGSGEDRRPEFGDDARGHREVPRVAAQALADGAHA